MANNANPTTATPAAENPQAAVDAAVSAERNRLAEIDSVASLFDPALVQEAKYGETACDWHSAPPKLLLRRVTSS